MNPQLLDGEETLLVEKSIVVKGGTLCSTRSACFARRHPRRSKHWAPAANHLGIAGRQVIRRGALRHQPEPTRLRFANAPPTWPA